MYPVALLVGVNCSEHVDFDLLAKPDLWIQISVRSYIKSDPAQIPVHELLMFELSRIQVHYVVVDLTSFLNILLFYPILDYIVDVVRKILPESIDILGVNEISFEGAH